MTIDTNDPEYQAMMTAMANNPPPPPTEAPPVDVKALYTYDPQTGVLLGTTPAPRDPLESELAGEPRYFQMAYSTFEAPPERGPGFTARFVNGAWELVADHRGEMWFDQEGRPVLIDTSGDPTALNLTKNPPPPSKAALKAYAANVRWKHEASGVTISGMPVSTDRESQALITGAVVWSQLNPSGTRKWKTGVGFVSLTAQQIQAIANAVATHVQACFDLEGELVEEIDAGTITTTAEIDGAAWPAGA